METSKLKQVGLVAGIAALLMAGAAQATPELLQVTPDLAKAKAASNEHPERFATPVAVSYSSQANGEWTSDGETSTWTLTVTIQGATSASFSARNVRLPAGAALSIAGADGEARQIPADWVQSGLLWSPIVAGESFTLVATMPHAEAGDFNMDLVEVQAGFRSVSEIPVTPQVSAKADAISALADEAVQPKAVGDVIPYTCKQPGGDRSVAKIYVLNQWQCTGTLINSSSGIVKPYLITAGHCSGGDVEASKQQLIDASPSIRAVFHYISSCENLNTGVTKDAELAGAVYRGSGQDLWMVELTHGVPANTVFEAFDARNRVPTEGGYTVHHGSGNPQQWIATTGYEAISNNGPYPGTFWIAGSELDGSGSAGASGSALRVGNAHAVIGSGFNVDGYSPLFYAWDSVGQYLGPSTTSTAVEGDSLPAPTMTLVADNAAPAAGAAVKLTWSSQNAFTCVPTSAWVDTIETSGSATVTAPTAGSKSYGMTCYGAGKNAAQSVTLKVDGGSGGDGGNGGSTDGDHKKGGGGAFGWGALLILGGLASLRRREAARS
jgi:hypothetical protein